SPGLDGRNARRPHLNRAPFLLRNPDEELPFVPLRVVVVEDLVDELGAADQRLLANPPSGGSIGFQCEVDALESIASLRHRRPPSDVSTRPSGGIMSAVQLNPRLHL